MRKEKDFLYKGLLYLNGMSKSDIAKNYDIYLSNDYNLIKKEVQLLRNYLKDL